MNKITLLVLLALAIGAAVAVFLLEENPAAPPSSELLFPELLKEDVSLIAWTVAGTGETTVRRAPERPDDWRVVIEGQEVPGAKVMVEEVLNELKRCRIERRLPPEESNATNRAEWLLDPPAHRIRFVMRDQAFEVRLGKLSLRADSLFAQIGDGGSPPEVLVIGSALLDSVKDLTAKDLRSRRIIDWSVTEIQSVTLRGDGETFFSAARDPRDRFLWRASHPFEAYVDPNAMETDLLPGLIGIEAAEFPADNVLDGQLEEYGLHEPRYEAAFTAKGAATPRTILIGASPEGAEDTFYYMEQGRPFVYLSKRSNVLLKLGEDPHAWRDRNITRLGWNPLGRVALRLGDTAFEMQNEHGEWHLTKPTKALLEQAATEGWLATVKDAEALEFADDPDLSTLGFDEPAGEVTIWKPVPDVHVHGEEGEEPGDDEEEAEPFLRLVIGKGAGDRAGVWVMRAGEPGTAYLAPGEIMDLFAKGHYPLVRPQVFVALDPSARTASRIVQTVEGRTTDLSAEDGKWPEGVRAAAVTSVVAKLLDLKAVRWVGAGADADEAFGLGDASYLRLRVSLDLGAGDTKEVGVDVGKKTEGGRFARAWRDGEPMPDVFVIEPRLTDPVMEIVDPEKGEPEPVDRGLQVPLRD